MPSPLPKYQHPPVEGKNLKSKGKRQKAKIRRVRQPRLLLSFAFCPYDGLLMLPRFDPTVTIMSQLLPFAF
jgi:hypothetical protein